MTSRMGSSDTAALVTLADQNQTIRGETPDDVRASIISTASAWASAHGEAVYLESTEDGQTWAIQVTPDGSMDEVPVAASNSSNVPAGTASVAGSTPSRRIQRRQGHRTPTGQPREDTGARRFRHCG